MKLLKLILLFACLLFLVFASSCKGKNCSETRYYLLNNDTAVIEYTGYETLKFVIEDSLGNFLDSATFKGVGKSKYFQDSDVENLTCGAIIYDKQNVDFTYLNIRDSLEKLIITLRKEEVGTEIFLYPPNKQKRNPFSGRATYFFNSFLDVFHDTITVKGKLYFSVVQFTTREQNYKSAYYGRYDSLIFFEESPNRIWYVVK